MPPLDRTLIAGLPPFVGMTPEGLDSVLSTARSARFEKDSAVFSQGEQARHFFLLLSGHIRVEQISSQGHQVVARYINAGELFGIAVAMGMPAYPATAVAAVESVAIAWPNRAWQDLQSLTTFGANAYRTIGLRLGETQARVLEMSSEEVEQRVANTLLRLAKQAGRKTEEGIEIDFPISRQEIAEMTGTTLHTVSRTLSSWENQGLVRSGRQKVTVTDPHGLLLVAENRRRR